MKDEKRIASSQRESDTQLLKFLVDDLSFTIQLLGTLKTQAMALQFNILTILPLLWTLQMSFFAMGSRKKLSWDGTGKKMFSFKMCLTVSNVCASQQLCASPGSVPFILGWSGWESCEWAVVLRYAAVMFAVLVFILLILFLSFCFSDYWTLSWHFRKLSRVILRPLSWIVNVEPIIAYV